MATPFFRRHFRGYFGISAPRMTVRMSPPWWVRGAASMALVALIGGIAWWAFDFGQLFGRVNRSEIDARVTAAENEAARARNDASSLRMRNSELESDLAMSRGAERALSQQASDLAAENARLREESTVLKRLVADAGRQSAARRAR
jgi:hypothetical protein